MRYTFRNSFATLLLISSMVVQADPVQFKVAASSSSKTYAAMTEQLMAVCGPANSETPDSPFVIQLSIEDGKGAIDNLEALVNNKVQAAFLHSDVIYTKAMADANYKKYKTLVNLYPEEIHVVALATALEKSGGVGGTSIGAKPNVYETLEDLEGLNVGAAGGSYITAKNLNNPGGGNFADVVQYKTGKDVLDGLRSGEIQAAIFVGGAPLPNIEGMSSDEFKLLPIGDKIVSRLTGQAGIYKKATLNYANLSTEVINTLSTDAIVLTKFYSTPKFVKPQQWFRTCFYDHLAELQETTGNHKKWGEVGDESEHGVWDWYDFKKVVKDEPKKEVVEEVPAE